MILEKVEVCSAKVCVNSYNISPPESSHGSSRWSLEAESDNRPEIPAGLLFKRNYWENEKLASAVKISYHGSRVEGKECPSAPNNSLHQPRFSSLTSYFVLNSGGRGFLISFSIKREAISYYSSHGWEVNLFLTTSHRNPQVPSCRHIQIPSRKQMVTWVFIISFLTSIIQCTTISAVFFVRETHITKKKLPIWQSYPYLCHKLIPSQQFFIFLPSLWPDLAPRCPPTYLPLPGALLPHLLLPGARRGAGLSLRGRIHQDL